MDGKQNHEQRFWKKRNTSTKMPTARTRLVSKMLCYFSIVYFTMNND